MVPSIISNKFLPDKFDITVYFPVISIWILVFLP